VLDAAAFGVPSELTEEEVMVALVPRQGATMDPTLVIEFCRSRMASHMLPRYVDVVEVLPRTPTEKIEKRELQQRGVTKSTWDREAQLSLGGD
jgi:crotonobetaine/carnitine-CoA ligase